MKNNYPEILLEIVKSAFLEKEESRILELLKNEINPDLLNKQIIFNGLRPAASFAFKNAKVSESDFEYLNIYNDFAQRQAFLNLGYTQLIKGLFRDFQNIGIRVIPYKGILFSNTIFDNKVIRESGDMDLLVYPEDARKALEYFFSNDYEFDLFNDEFKFSDQDEIITSILASKGKYEQAFNKNGLHIDLHWGLNYGFMPYKVDYLSFFENITEKSNQVLPVIPSVETMFWMIILHHGGKEIWVKQKHLIDLMAFLRKYSEELDWEKQINLSKEYKLYKILITGFYLIKKLYDFPVPEIIEKHFHIINLNQIDRILDYHCYSKNWNTLFARLRYEKVLINNQDEGFSLRNYIYEIYKEYSIPNPLEHGRFISFPEKYRFLNFISKIITYGIKKMF